jgi:hypothetical protein
MKFLHSFTDPTGNTRISPWVWLVLLLSGASLVMAVLLANLGMAAVGAVAYRVELVPALAAGLALAGVLASGFGIWRKGGMTA